MERSMAEGLSNDENIPFEVVFKGVVTTPEEIKKVCVEANGDSECAGVISWMHTFSPSKMWIGGLSDTEQTLSASQYAVQQEHSVRYDRYELHEHEPVGARRQGARVYNGEAADEEEGHMRILGGQGFRSRIGGWMRSAVGAMFSRSLKVMRLGDNMRYVAVTEGDKIQAEKDLGWSVNTYGVGGFVELVKKVTDAQVEC